MADKDYAGIRLSAETRDMLKALADADRRPMTTYLDLLIAAEYAKLETIKQQQKQLTHK